jgi:hypothetical protein
MIDAVRDERFRGKLMSVGAGHTGPPPEIRRVPGGPFPFGLASRPYPLPHFSAQKRSRDE